MQVCFSSGASVRGSRFSVARYSLILARQSSRQVSLKKDFSAEEEDFAEDEDAATFSEELLASFDEEDFSDDEDTAAFSDEELLTGFDDEDEDFSEDEDAANFSDDELFVDF